jgi:hypothetical protein
MALGEASMIMVRYARNAELTQEVFSITGFHPAMGRKISPEQRERIERLTFLLPSGSPVPSPEPVRFGKAKGRYCRRDLWAMVCAVVTECPILGANTIDGTLAKLEYVQFNIDNGRMDWGLGDY